MQIIAGAARGRRLKVPREGTRPMTSRARESIFSILQWKLPGANVLDLFAGSGSLGLESLSRGAADAVFVDRGRHSCACIEQNIAAVGLGGVLMCQTVETALEQLTARFDLVFVDPPYADDDRAVLDVLAGIESVLAVDGLVVLHRQESSASPTADFLTSIDERLYGDARVTVYERKQT
ncbi:MAG: 16S rRNA (guanine(966)-N(2))-methyltransferase RsmD [Acidimicrobiia bacterium]